MSGVSHYVSKPFPSQTPYNWTRNGNPPPSNYFKSREVNFNEFYEQAEQYQPYYDYYQYESDFYDQPEFTDSSYYTCYPETLPPQDEPNDDKICIRNADYPIFK